MRSTRAALIALLASLAVAASLPAVAVSASESESGSSADFLTALSNFPQFADLPDSAVLDAPDVLHGTVAQITGEVMPGAQVLLSAWPKNEDLKALPNGSTFDIVPIARAVADGAGNYRLRAAVTEAWRDLSGPDGIDVEIDVFHANRHYVYLSQVTPTSDGAWVRELTGLPTKFDEVVDQAGTLLDLTLDRAKSSLEKGLGVGAVTSAYTYRKPTAPGCTPFEKVRTESVKQTIATAVARNGASVQLTFGSESRVESSTGASLGGAFAINGSRSRAFGLDVKFQPLVSKKREPVNVEYRVRMDHLVVRRSCARDFQGNEDVLHLTSPVAGSTDGTKVMPSRYRLWKCRPSETDRRVAPLDGAESVATTKHRASTYAGAFNFEPVPGSGFTGSALSGYNETVGGTFLFDPKAPLNNRWWCGNTSKPRTPGQRVQGFVG